MKKGAGEFDIYGEHHGHAGVIVNDNGTVKTVYIEGVKIDPAISEIKGKILVAQKLRKGLHALEIKESPSSE